MGGLTYGTYGAGTALTVIGLCTFENTRAWKARRQGANMYGQTCCLMAKARHSTYGALNTGTSWTHLTPRYTGRRVHRIDISLRLGIRRNWPLHRLLRYWRRMVRIAKSNS
jgi:hypothetical protein